VSDPRPKCYHCGRPYGRRKTEAHRYVVAEGESPPPFQTNQQIVRQDDRPYGSAQHIYNFETWDGTWVKKYEPFCSKTCALDFAQRCAEKGIRP
jgi:endogenous inhibitor of DNA gyrase (YacG/DUF329 family)